MNLSTSLLFSQIQNTLSKELNKGIVASWENCLDELPPLISGEDKELLKNYYLVFTEFDFIKDVLEMEAFEYIFHSPQIVQIFLTNGEKIKYATPFNDVNEWQLWLELISVKYSQNWNHQNPFTSFYAEIKQRKSRISLIHYSTSPEGISKLILRPIKNTPFDLNIFGHENILHKLLTSKSNVLIAGSTGSGKTSLLSSMLNEIHPDDHLVILEDTYEIQNKKNNVTRFLSGEGEKNSLKAYLTYSLRLTPDRLVVGEMRSLEVIPFVLALNTGIKGLMSTIHSSSAVEAIHRLALLFSLYHSKDGINLDSLIELICKNLEYVIYVENKKIKNIIRILGSERGTPYFECLVQN
jgi:type IV secretion system protein VirB11